jgi:hypothetical protein
MSPYSPRNWWWWYCWWKREELSSSRACALSLRVDDDMQYKKKKKKKREKRGKSIESCWLLLKTAPESFFFPSFFLFFFFIWYCTDAAAVVSSASSSSTCSSFLIAFEPYSAPEGNSTRSASSSPPFFLPSYLYYCLVRFSFHHSFSIDDDCLPWLLDGYSLSCLLTLCPLSLISFLVVSSRVPAICFQTNTVAPSSCVYI